MRRLGFVSAIAAVALVGLLPGSVAAAPVMTFGASDGAGLMLRSKCINGRGPADSSAHVVWKRSDGTIKAIVDVPTNFAGSWMYCSATRRLGVGDTIRARSGSFGRTFTMPNITLNFNRVATTFSGIGLPGRTGQLWYHAGLFADFFTNEQVTADAAGQWSLPYDTFGGIEASVEWTTVQGDILLAQGVVPNVTITIGRAAVEGGYKSLSEVSVSVRDPLTNALRGRATAATDEYGFFTGAFSDSSGNQVNARVGDRIVSSMASNLDWHVPQIAGNADTANDIVYGNCGSSEIEPLFAMVRVFRTGTVRGVAITDTEADGDLVADFTGNPAPFYRPANIKVRDRVVISCYYDTGDVVQFSFRAP